MTAWHTRQFQDAEALLLGLDLGLADLFDEDVLAALEWLQEGRIELNGQTPLDHINGALRDVQKILDAARNVG